MKQGACRPGSGVRAVVRAVLLMGMLLLAIGPLVGCMEQLQTGRPAPARPSPSLPVPPMAAGDAPTEATEALPVPTDLPFPNTIAPVETATPTLEPLPTATPEPAATIVAPTFPPLSNEERWRGQQVGRDVFAAPRAYTTTSSELWWYDPVNQQHVILGSFAGTFEAQARFTLLGQGVEALEVPYRVNQRYGLTALSPALVQRIAEAGYDEWIETYVFLTPNVRPLS